MKNYKAVGTALGGVVTALSFLVGSVVVLYMTEYGMVRFAAAAVVIGVGTAGSIATYMALAKSKMKVRAAGALLSVILLCLCAALLSMFLPGRVIHSQFGLTVYGAIPIPALDIVVHDNGLLWFRDKTHHVTLAEARSYLSPETDAMVIGTGWDGVVRVDPEVRQIDGVEVFTLRSPDAFRKYNALKSEGKNVVLIAHSTC